ncbi:MAG TPA: glutamate--tRNA ligase [Acidobacteriota bacterium]|nr:glutamate--tRNA ligase [Acidobacteriota bacterium]
MTQDLTQFFTTIALENAAKYAGKTQAKALVGKAVGTHPDLRKDMPALMQQLEAAVAKVNAMSLDEQQKLLASLGHTTEKRAHRDKDELKELDNAKHGNVVMRFAPSVSAPHMHIGHAITGGLTSLYCKKYNGKFIFRLEDTNSDKIELEAYTNFPNEAQWIFGNVSEVVIQSDRLELYYKYAKLFLTQGNMYACECSPEKFKEYVEAQSNCPCRDATPDIQLKRYERMFDKQHGYQEGQVVLRFKSDMKHPNPAMRDFPLMRINDSAHSKVGTKYRVWPLMNLSVFVDDVEMGMTHIIRAKDHLDNSKRQEMMYNAIGKKPPMCYFTGRYNIEGLELSKTKTMEAIAQGKYTGWDDIRLPFLGPMRRRGYQPGSFLKFSAAVGLSPVDKTISAEDFFKTLDAFNKEIIDPIAHRHYVLFDPQQISINNLPQSTDKIELALHPQDRQAGGRLFDVNTEVLIEKDDLANVKEGTMVRLMDFCNVIKKGDDFLYASEGYDEYKNHKGHKIIIHWLPKDPSQHMGIQMLMPDNSVKIGIAEYHVAKHKVDDIVQFERFGFARLDEKKNDGSLVFWFAHR